MQEERGQAPLPSNSLLIRMKFEHFTSIEQKRRTLPLYEDSFPEDRGAYAAYYYEGKCRNNEVFVLTALESSDSLPDEKVQKREVQRAGKQKKICAMLHLNPYQMWISTKSMQLHYIVAVATALPYRRQGCMRMLMKQAFFWMYQREEAFTYLMPADPVYYEPFGFRVVYEQKTVSFPADIDQANRWARERFDVVTLRDESYIRFLEAEPKEASNENSEKDSLTSGSSDINDWRPQIMCRIVHVVRFLECLRAAGHQIIYLFIRDSLIWDNAGWFCWQIDEDTSRVQRLKNRPSEILPDGSSVIQDGIRVSCLEIDIADLAKQLFGAAPLHPALSQIRILKRICINEEV